MANEISMLQRQMIAALHARGHSNRTIARLLALHRETVNRHVRLLKIQNRPEAPAGETPEKPRVIGKEPEGAEPGILPPPLATDVIWEEDAGEARSPLVSSPEPGAENPRSQNRPGAPAGRLSQYELFDSVPRLAFATWEDPRRSLREAIQNQPEVPAGDPVVKAGGWEAATSRESPLVGQAEIERAGLPVNQNRPEAPAGTIMGNSPPDIGAISDLVIASGEVIPGLQLSANSQRPGITTSLCTEHHEFIKAGLERGLEAQRIWQDLVNERGFRGQYWSVKRYVARLRARQPLPFRRLETAAGVEAQVDFGQGAWIPGEDGKRRRPWVFRVVLSHSRKGYSEVVWRQTTEVFIECLENAFRHFGGVPERIVLDNLKAAVTKADWYDPELHPKIESFAAHHGTVFLPTKPYTPRHKGKIEGGVKYVQNNALAGRSFRSLEEQNEYLWHWETQVADQRIHGTTKRQVRALFEEQEQRALRPLPTARFPLFREERRTVHRDGYVEVDKAYYAAPPEYVGRTVWVRWDSRILRIYDDRWSPLYAHAITTAGKFRSCPGAIPQEKISAVERGVDVLLKQVSRIGPQTREWASATALARGVEGSRILLGLRALTHTHEAAAIEEACAVALANGSYRLRTIRQLLKREGNQKQEQFEFTQEHPVIRPLADYSLASLSEFRRDRSPLPQPPGDES